MHTLILRCFQGALLAIIMTSQAIGGPLPADKTEQKSYAAIGLGVEYASGTFGTANRTDFISIPLTIDIYPTDRSDLELVIPYLYQSNNATLFSTGVHGTPRMGQSSAKLLPAMNGPMGQGGSSGSTAAATASDSSLHGLGDITLTAGYVVLEEGDLLPQLRLTGYVKFPTADQDAGLGSGQFDSGPGISLSKWVDDWQLFGEASYIFQGKSGSLSPKSYAAYSGGIGNQLSETFYTSLQVKGGTAPTRDSPAPLEGRVNCRWRPLAKTGIESYAGKGFTTGSPDYIFSLALFQYF